MRLKVYYLDDEQDLVEAFGDVFSDEFVEVSTFVRPDDLVLAARAARPDLVFLDYRLPGTTGPEVAKRLDPDIPKVLVTGDLATEESDGFVASLEKPVKLDAVQRLFEQYLKPRKS